MNYTIYGGSLLLLMLIFGSPIPSDQVQSHNDGPVTITIEENIQVSDDSVKVLPPIQINVSEDISVDDEGH